MKRWTLTILLLGLCSQPACIFFAEDNNTNGNNTTKDMTTKDMVSDLGLDMPTPVDMGRDMANPPDMKPDMKGPDMSDMSDMPDPPDMMACAATPETICCEPTGPSADLQTDNNNCGICGNVCAAGAQCQAGLCICEPDASLANKPATPVIVADNLPATTQANLFQYVGVERLKPCATATEGNTCPKGGFENFFVNDPTLLHYMTVYRQPNESQFHIVGLNGHGAPVGPHTLLKPLSKGMVAQVGYTSRLGGMLSVYILYKNATNDVIQHYVIGKKMGSNQFEFKQNFTLNGEKFISAPKLIAMGNHALFDEEIFVYVKQKEMLRQGTLEGRVLKQNTALEFELPSVALKPGETPAEGAMLIPRYEVKTDAAGNVVRKDAMVTWWVENPLTPGQGTYYGVAYTTDNGAMNDLVATPVFNLGTGRVPQQGHQRKMFPLGLIAGKWSMYHIVEKQNEDEAQITVPTTNQNNIGLGAATHLFEPSLAIYAYKQDFITEFAWLQNNSTRTKTGQIYYHGAKATADSFRLGAPELLTNGTQYFSVKQAFGLPGTMGYLGTRLNNDLVSLHFMMTSQNRNVCNVPKTPEP